MIKKLIQNIWILLLGYIIYNVYFHYTDHQEKMLSTTESIPGIKSRIVKNKQKIKELEGYFNDIDSAKERIERVAGEVEKIQRKFPSEIVDSFYISALMEFSKTLNMKKVEVRSGKEENKGFYYVKDFEFAAQGTFLQFLILLEKIENYEKLLNISKFKLTELSEKQKGRFQMIDGKITIQAYRHDPNHKEDRGIDNIEKSFEEKKNKKKANKNKGRKK